MMKEVYRIVGICLGIPPQTFTWEYVDKTKQVRSILDIFEYFETFRTAQKSCSN